MTTQKAILCALVLAFLAGCGVKPGNVKPPEGARDIYPSVYPSPSITK